MLLGPRLDLFLKALGVAAISRYHLQLDTTVHLAPSKVGH